MKINNRFIIVAIASIMFFSSSFVIRAEGEPKTIAESEKTTELSDGQYEELEFDYGTIKESNIQDHVSHFNNEPAHVGLPAYTASYISGLTYVNNDKVTVKVDVVFNKIYDETSPNNKHNYVSIRDDMVLVSTRTTDSDLDDCKNVDHFSEATVTISFYDENGNDYYVPNILLGLKDPDAGDYTFDVNRDIFYKDVKSSDEETWSSFYLLTSKGIEPKERKDVAFPGPLLLLRLKNEKSFTFTINGYNDNLDLPVFYSLKYNISYELNGGTNHKDNPGWYAEGQEIDIQDPTRPGYRFLGWTRKDISDPESKKNSSIKSDDIEDKTFVAEWEKIEYKLAYDKNHDNATGEMANQIAYVIDDNKTKKNTFENVGYSFKGWSTKPGDELEVEYQNGEDVPVVAADVAGKEEGDVVKTLYAQWEPKEYEILYNPNDNDNDHKVENPTAMVTQVFTVVKNTDEWFSHDSWTYKRDGYDFDGYKIENDGDVLKTPEKFKAYLLNQEDQKVELYAQWKPWVYYIKYDGNGADNMDAMDTQIFDYFAKSMESKENAFKRNGYRFTGFKVTIDGNTRIIRKPEDFIEVLKGMDPYSSITLVAQWDKIPERFVTPVTGIK